MTNRDRNRKRKQELRRRAERIERRLREREWEDQDRPMLGVANIQYEIAGRDRGIAVGGMGVIHRMMTKLGLPDDINRGLPLLKRHLPYLR